MPAPRGRRKSGSRTSQWSSVCNSAVVPPSVTALSVRRSPALFAASLLLSALIMGLVARAN